jgi:hypothetical protein
MLTAFLTHLSLHDISVANRPLSPFFGHNESMNGISFSFFFVVVVCHCHCRRYQMIGRYNQYIIC